MDKKLFNYFINELNFDEEDIENLSMLCPGLDIVDAEKAFDCLNAITKHGFPKEDLDFLLTVNPQILMYEVKELDTKLKTIKGDLEEKLKDNPFII